jgi:hypothetical protein
MCVQRPELQRPVNLVLERADGGRLRRKLLPVSSREEVWPEALKRSGRLAEKANRGRVVSKRIKMKCFNFFLFYVQKSLRNNKNFLFYSKFKKNI